MRRENDKKGNESRLIPERQKHFQHFFKFPRDCFSSALECRYLAFLCVCVCVCVGHHVRSRMESFVAIVVKR